MNKQYRDPGYSDRLLEALFINSMLDGEDEIIGYKNRLAYIRAIKTNRGCAKCGEEDYRCLDFHHVSKGLKKYNIGSVIMNSKVKWSDISLEIDKCIVLCANCHRKHHAKLV